MAGNELQLGEFLASAQWISFPGFTGSSQNFVFIFTSKTAATNFGKQFTDATIHTPGGKVKISSHKVKERDGIFELTLNTGPDDSVLRCEITRLFKNAVYDGYGVRWFRERIGGAPSDDEIRRVLQTLVDEGKVIPTSSGRYFYWAAKKH